MILSIKKETLIQSIEHSNLAHTISSIDGDMELIYVNQAFLDDTGYERDEVIGHNCRFLQGKGTSKESIQKIRDAVKKRESIDIEILNYKKDGASFWNRLRMSPVYDENDEAVAYIGIQSDVTEIREAQRFEQERQKLEALGRMTGNISHEIKNALQPVKLIAETLENWQNLDDAKIQRCIEILNENVKIADNITQDVLRFSRKSGENLEKTDIKNLYKDTSRFIQNILHGQIEYIEEGAIEEAGGEAENFVHIRMNHFYQILLNLVNNALYAMNNNGILTLYWSEKYIDSDEAACLNVTTGDYLCISIKDNGAGMDDKVLGAAFDPFFSTKPPGEGTGLGLSISYRMIREWGGVLCAKSELSKGSTLTVYLPTSS